MVTPAPGGGGINQLPGNGDTKPDEELRLFKLIQLYFKQRWQPGSAPLPLGSALSSAREPESAPSTSPSDSPPSKSLPDYRLHHQRANLTLVTAASVWEQHWAHCRPVVDGCCRTLPLVSGQTFGVNPDLQVFTSNRQTWRAICLPSFAQWIKPRA